MDLNVSFFSQVTSNFQKVLKVLLDLEFTPYLVGGIPRDFLLKNTIGNDWDFQLAHDALGFDSKLWSQLEGRLRSLGLVTKSNFEVITLTLYDETFEFSPPRLEIYDLTKSDQGHSDFETEFDFKMDYAKSCVRRDFTINAIALKFISIDSFEIIDPLNGRTDLDNKLLKACGDNFLKDPVRILRAYRFSLNLNFKLEEKLFISIKDKLTDSLSAFHFKKELLKCHSPIEFLKLCQANQKYLNFLSALNLEGIEEQFEIVKVEDLTFILLSKNISIKLFVEYLNYSLNDYKKFENFWSNLKYLQLTPPEKLKGSFEEISHGQEFLIFTRFIEQIPWMKQKISFNLEEYLNKNLSSWKKYIDQALSLKAQSKTEKEKYLWNLFQK